MKKQIFTLFILLSAFIHSSFAQNVTVNSTTGSALFGQYFTLKEAFDSINSGYHTGVIDITITGSTSEGTATARLDSSGSISSSGTSSYTAISIKPLGGTITISGNTTAGNPLIDLNGADNVLFDGMSNGFDSLIIVNTTASTTSNTSTIRMINDATHNTITNVKVLSGFKSSSLTTNGGAIFFSNTFSGGSGNDNNTISNCYVSNASSSNADFAYKLLFIAGTTTDSTTANNNILITNNHFVNFRTTGVYVYSGAKDIVISNNHFYHNTAMPSSSTFSPISINNTTANIGENFTVSGNYIGGSDAFCGGTMPTLLFTSYFQVIYIGSAITATSYVSGNTISNINIQTTYSSTEAGLIYIKNGKVNISNNLLGSLSDTSNVIMSHNSSSGGTYAFITVGGNSAGTFDSIMVENNIMSGITLKSLSSNTPSVRGFDNAGSTGTFILRNNYWGIPGLANSIQVYGNNGNSFGAIFRNSSSNAHEFVNNYIGNFTSYNSTATAGRLRALSLNISTWRADSNTIENIVAYTANVATSANVQSVGIFCSGLSGSCIGNTIRNIIAANPGSLSSAMGMDITGTPGVMVAGNTISNVYALSSDSALVVGIRLNGNLSNNFIVHNNQISLGRDSLGLDITAGHRFIGILQESGNTSIYFNSVLVAGIGANNTVNTYAIYVDAGDSADIRNNVFSNQRSFMNTPLNTSNYAAAYDGTIGTGFIPGFTINFNLYYAPGIGGMAVSNNGTSYFDLNTWKTAAYFYDANSIWGNPDFVSYAELKGSYSTAITVGDLNTGINIDITNTPRVYYMMGAYDLTNTVPVELLFVKADNVRSDVLLTWSTASETNNKGFAIERSVDSRKFAEIGFLKGKTNSTVVVNYAFNDNDAFNKTGVTTLYYRLKQLDNDGAFKYSKVVSVTAESNAARPEAVLYPNPVNDVLNLKIQSAEPTTLFVQIFDIAGKEMVQFDYPLNAGENQISMDSASLKNGVYFVEVNLNGEKQIHKIIKY